MKKKIFISNIFSWKEFDLKSGKTENQELPENQPNIGKLLDLNSNCSNLLDMRNFQELTTRNKLKKHFVSKIILTKWPYTVPMNCSSDLKFFVNNLYFFYYFQQPHLAFMWQELCVVEQSVESYLWYVLITSFHESLIFYLAFAIIFLWKKIGFSIKAKLFLEAKFYVFIFT